MQENKQNRQKKKKEMILTSVGQLLGVVG